MRFVDLTHPIEEGMPVWPGDSEPQFREKTSVEETGYSVHAMLLSDHTGTHLDAPSHVIQGGTTLDGIPLETLIGRAALLDLTAKGAKDVINREDIEQWADRLEPGGRVLVKTGWDRRFNSPAFYEDFPCFTLEAARYLVSRRIILLGMDVPSPSPLNDPEQAIHKAFLGAGVVLLESLRNLTLLRAEECDLIALPPLFKGLSGSPCRVVAAEWS